MATGRRGVTVRTSDSRESPPAWSRANLTDGQSPLGAPLGARLSDPALIGHCWHSQIARSAQAVKWVQIDLGRSQLLDEVRLIPARLPQRLHREGYGFPVRFRVESDDDPTFAQPRLLLDHTSAPFVNPGFSPVTVPAGLAARYVRVTATELQHRGDGQYHFALGELQVYAGNRNLASLTLLSELCLQSATVPRADLAELHALARETAHALRDVTWFVRPGAHTAEQFL